jgi:hypothetical protein
LNRQAFQRAARCFEVARSTKFDGERAAAINRGERIASRAGISLDLFDIPGHEHAVDPRPVSDMLFEGSGIFGDNYSYSYSYAEPRPRSTSEVLSQVDEMVARAAAQRAAVAEEHRRRTQAKVDSAVAFLRERRHIVERVNMGYLLDGVFRLPTSILEEALERGWQA